MTPALEAFFARYEEGANSFDPDLVCSLYTSEFLGGGPGGVVCGRNNQEFREAIVRRHTLFQEIGFKRAAVLGVDATPLDKHYTMAKVTYFLYDTGTGPRVAAWISHDDEQEVMREAGLIPGKG